MGKVLVVGAISNYTIKQFVRAARNLELTPLFVFHHNHIPKVAELNDDSVLSVGTLDIEGFDQLVEHLEPLKTEIRSIVPGGELAVPISEALCRYFALPHNPGNVERFRNKALMRDVLSRVGVLQPAIYAQVSCQASLSAVKQNLQYPLVIKPVDGAASFFVKKIQEPSELGDAINQIVNYASSKATGVQLLRRALLEQFIHGDEYSAEVLVSSGRRIKYFVTRKILSEEPYFDEVGHVSLLSQDEPSGTDELVNNVISSMMVDNGVLHIEFRKTADGQLFVIEVAARIAGDLISNIVEKTHSQSLETFYILARSKHGQHQLIQTEHQDSGIYTGVKFLFGDAPRPSVTGIRVIENDLAQQYNQVDNVSPYNVLRRQGYEIFQADSLEKSIHYIR